MIFITIVTAVLLLLTLESQKKVQEDQAKINKLNMYDIRDKHSAKFDIVEKIEIKAHELGFIEIIVRNSMALDVNISMDVNYKIESFRNIETIPTTNSKLYNTYIQAIPKDLTFKIEIIDKRLESIQNLFLKSKSENLKDNVDYCSLMIKYKDNSGFEYIKSFKLIANPSKMKLMVDKTNDNYL